MINFSVLAFLDDACSTSSSILVTVDSPNSFVTLIFNTPFKFIQPLITLSPVDTVRGTDSPVSAEVSKDACPSVTIPSSGIFSPVLTVIISPTFTSCGETFSPHKFA